MCPDPVSPRRHTPWPASPKRVLQGAVLLCLSLCTAAAQTSQADILAQLKDKPLFLRGLWEGDHLQFDETGKLLQPSKRQPFTLSGFDVEKVTAHDDQLEIQGRRVGLTFDKAGTPHRVRLVQEATTISIAGHPGDDFGPALQAIFAPNLETLIPSTKAYWQGVGRQFLRSTDPSAGISIAGTPGSDDLPCAATGFDKSVKQPVLVQSSQSSYTVAAAALQYSGTVEVGFCVEPSGRPSHLTVIKPTGLGLDEMALSSVASFRFKPGLRDGIAIPVRISLKVSFAP